MLTLVLLNWFYCRFHSFEAGNASTTLKIALTRVFNGPFKMLSLICFKSFDFERYRYITYLIYKLFT